MSGYHIPGYTALPDNKVQVQVNIPFLIRFSSAYYANDSEHISTLIALCHKFEVKAHTLFLFCSAVECIHQTF